MPVWAGHAWSVPTASSDAGEEAHEICVKLVVHTRGGLSPVRRRTSTSAAHGREGVRSSGIHERALRGLLSRSDASEAVRPATARSDQKARQIRAQGAHSAPVFARPPQSNSNDHDLYDLYDRYDLFNLVMCCALYVYQ